jgi:outer membrane receptor protein involved in Fe transport
MRRRSLWMFTLLCTTALPGLAAAQEPGGGVEVGEIVVTADRQGATAISKVPMSIAAQTQENLDQLGIKTAQDLSRIVPALRIEPNGATGANISIRGIRSTNGAATTGVYLDDSALQTRTLTGVVNGGGVFIPQLFDLERVEVLKGPQGTLYGGSSEGGTIRFITPAPSLTRYSAYAKSEINTVNQGGIGGEFGAAVGGPVVQDKLGFRLSGWGRRVAGYVDHVDRLNPSKVIAEDTNKQDQLAFRLAATWAAAPNLRITPAVYYGWDRKYDSDTVYEDIPEYTTPAFGTVVGGANNDRPVFGAYTGTPLTSGVNAGQNITGGLLPAGYVAPTTARIVTDIPGMVGQQVFVHPAHTYARVDLGDYDTVVNIVAGDNYAGKIYPDTASRRSRILLPSLTLDAELGPLQAKSITTYVADQGRGRFASSLQNVNNTTATAGYAPSVQSGFVFDATEPLFTMWRYFARRFGISEELRFTYAPEGSRLTAVAGMYFSNANTRSYGENVGNRSAAQQALFGHPQRYNALHPPEEILTQIQQGTNQQLHEQTLAGFGEANFKLTRKLKLTAGVRVSREELSYTSYTYGLLFASTFTTGTLLTGGVKETPVTPKFGISYQATDDNLFYATAAKGYRAGGVQGQANPTQCAADLAALNITQTPASYGSDSVWSYEGGAKIKLLDRKLSLAGSVFNIDWKLPQTPYTLPTCAFNYITNIGKAVSRGFDLQGEFKATSRFSVNFSVGYTDAHYTEEVLTQPNASGVRSLLVAKGQPFVGVPKWNGNVGVRYNFEVKPGWDGYFIANYQYNGSFFNSPGPGINSYAPDVYMTGAQENVTARIGMNAGRYDISAFVDNLMGEKGLTYSSLGGRASCRNTDCSLYGSYYYARSGITYRPRTIGLTVNYRY